MTLARVGTVFRTLRDRGVATVGAWPRALRWGAGAAAAFVLALLVFFGQPDWDWARGMTVAVLSARLHRPVHIAGPLRVHLLSASPSVTLTGITVEAPKTGLENGPKGELAEIGSLTAYPDILPLLIGQLHLRRLEMERPAFVLFQDGAGRSNWDFSGGRDPNGASKLPPVRTLIIRDGTATVTLTKRRLTVSGPFSADIGSGFRFSGAGTEDGKPCTVTATGPQLGRQGPYPFQVLFQSGPTQVLAAGRFLRPFDFGQLSVDMHLRGASLSDLYYLLAIPAPNTPDFDLKAHVDRNQKLYKIGGISGHIGNSDLTGGLTIDRRGKRSMLTGDLSSRMLDAAQLGSVFGATQANRPQKPHMRMMPRAATAANLIMPDARLDVERLRSGDAKVTYRALSVRPAPGMPMRTLSFTATLDQGLLRFDPVVVGFARGQAAGMATIDARGPVQRETIDVRLTGLRLEEFTKGGSSPPVEGPVSATIRASGTGNSVHLAAANANGEVHVVVPGGRLRQSLAEALGVNATKSLFLLLAKDPHQTDIHCAVADFRVRNGVMQAQRIVLDTDVVLVNGSGSVDLRTERIDLAFRGKPKQFRLVRIDAPIVVGGHLSQPTFGISAAPAAAAQGGLAAAVGSLLPFVTLDYAKDADCGALTER